MGSYTGRIGKSALLPALALLVAACSGGASSTATPAATAVPTTAPTTAPSAAPSGSTAPTGSAVGDQIAKLFGVAVPDPSCDVKGKTVHYVTAGKFHPVIRLFMQGFIDGAAELGMKPVMAVPDAFDSLASVTLAEQALATGSDGMVFLALDPAYNPIMKKAADKGVPVIGTHALFKPGEVLGMTANVGFDNLEEGQAIAKTMAPAVGEKGAIAITQGGFNVTENNISKAFTDYVTANYPNMTVLKAEEAGFDPPKAIAKAVAILQAHPDVVGAFDTSGGAVTWQEAQKQTGRQLFFMTTDFTRENLDFVKGGSMFAVIGEPSYPEHYIAARVLARIICGDPVPFQSVLPVPIITTDLLAPYYVFNEYAGQ